MDFFNQISTLWENLTTSANYLVAFLVCVLAFSVLYFYLISFMAKYASKGFVFIFFITMIISAVVFCLLDKVGSEAFIAVPLLFILITIILYSVELKRIIWVKNNTKLVDVKHGNEKYFNKEKVDNCISEIIKALQNMSKNDIGAILVLSSDNIPSQIIDSGITLDSDISSELIESVFFPKTPLHDGAMIISDTKIKAAGCFLPLSQNPDAISKDFGSRHRAGIGVTETIDVVSLIVSEETGVISIASGGKLTKYADAEMLKKVLNKYYWQKMDNN